MQLQESQNCEFIITFFNKEKTFMKKSEVLFKMFRIYTLW